MRERRIEIVKDGLDKQLAYRRQMQRYEKALKDGFYYEALLIIYAALEDRLRSFIYYLGIIRNREDSKPNVRKTKKQIRVIFFGSEENATNRCIDLTKISVKTRLLQKVTEWVCEQEDLVDDYEKLLKKNMINVCDLDYILSVLEDINTWLYSRNEIIHGLLNKNYSAADSSAELLAIECKTYVRAIDSQVKALRSKCTIRKLLKI